MVPDTAALPLLLRQESTDKGTCVHVAPKVMPLARVDHRGLSDRTAVVAYLQGFWPQMPKAVQSCIHVASLALGSLRAGLTVSSITTSLPTSRFGIKRTTAPLGVEVNSLLALLAGLSEERKAHVAHFRDTQESTLRAHKSAWHSLTHGLSRHAPHVTPGLVPNVTLSPVCRG